MSLLATIDLASLLMSFVAVGSRRPHQAAVCHNLPKIHRLCFSGMTATLLAASKSTPEWYAPMPKAAILN
jgi:hypothetical protein